MAFWFLRRFTAFREMEALAAMQAEAAEAAQRHEDENASLIEDIANLKHAKDELIAEKRALEDQLAAALRDKDQLWETMRQAMEGERYALHTMVNHATQKNGGGVPYQDGHALPPTSLPKPQVGGPIGRRGRMLSSEMETRMNMEFVRNVVSAPAPDAENKAA